CGAATAAAGTRELTVASGGRERGFRLVVPESALGGVPVPLVVLFHGSNGDGAKQIAMSRFDRKAAAEGFVVAAGNGVDRSWNTGFCRDPGGRACVTEVDDVAFARDLVAAAAREACIDPERVYATGFSKGAAMVLRLACEASDLFAAFAPVAGALTIPCAPERPRPILLVNALDDVAAPFALAEASFDRLALSNGCGETRETILASEGGTCEAAPDCRDGATTALCAVPGHHRWPGGAADPAGTFDATDAVWRFFAEHPA
ncbi:MAG: PHB depolymerase family esterase, partial [Thermodesulfobacteriota bacterium]